LQEKKPTAATRKKDEFFSRERRVQTSFPLA